MSFVVIGVLVFWSLTAVPSLLIGILRLRQNGQAVGRADRPTWTYFLSAAYAMATVCILAWLNNAGILGEFWTIAGGSLVFMPEAAYVLLVDVRSKQSTEVNIK